MVWTGSAWEASRTTTSSVRGLRTGRPEADGSTVCFRAPQKPSCPKAAPMGTCSRNRGKHGVNNYNLCTILLYMRFYFDGIVFCSLIHCSHCALVQKDRNLVLRAALRRHGLRVLHCASLHTTVGVNGGLRRCEAQGAEDAWRVKKP